MGGWEGEMRGGVGGVEAVSRAGREVRKIVTRWHWKLAFVVGFTMFTASIGALSEVSCGSQHVFRGLTSTDITTIKFFLLWCEGSST